MRELGNAKEAPLPPLQRFWLVVSITGILVASFVGALLMTIGLLVLIFCELCLLIAATRFGLGRLVTPLLQEHGDLLLVFARSIWITDREEDSLALRREEAPDLFGVVDGFASSLQIRPPSRILIVASTSAWVRLDGWRKGKGRTTLALGMDLLAGLDQSEVAAVIAHELAHAKCVNRGLNQFHHFGLRRIIKVRELLREIVSRNRSQEKGVEVGQRLFQAMNALCLTATRRTAAYSRQDEFDADALAASLASPAALASSLLKIPHISGNASRLSWTSRVIKLDSKENYSEWIHQKLTEPWLESEESVRRSESDNETGDLRNPYSTHPTESDRIAALPAHEPKTSTGTSALAWFRQPDKLARELLNFLASQALKGEKAEARDLKKSLRQFRRLRRINAKQWGVIIGAIAIVLLIGNYDQSLKNAGLRNVIAGLLVAMVVGYRLAMDGDIPQFSLPRFSSLASFKDSPGHSEEVEERDQSLEVAASRSVSGKDNEDAASELIKTGFEAFSEGDLLKTHVASRLATQKEKRTVEGHLLHAVAAAAFDQFHYYQTCLGFVAQQQGLRGGNTLTLAGCAAWLANDHFNAEVFLTAATKTHRHATTLAILAAVQHERGKNHSALEAVESALQMDPTEVQALLLKARILISFGRVALAREILEAPLPVEFAPKLRLLQLSVSENELDAATTERLVAEIPQETQPEWLVRYASVLMGNRETRYARALWERVLGQGHFPEAHLCLGYLDLKKGAYSEARAHALAALPSDRNPGKGGKSAYTLFESLLEILYQCNPRIPDAKAWLFRFSKGNSAGDFRGRTMLVYAQTQEKANDYMVELVKVFNGSKTFEPMLWVTTELAPRDVQPQLSVHPGVQSVWSVS